MSHMIRTVLAGAAVAATAGFLVAPAASAAQPAHAGTTAGSQVSAKATGFNRCPHGWFCVFSKKNGQGKIFKYKNSVGDLPYGVYGNVQSQWNRSCRNIVGWSKVYYTGTDRWVEFHYGGPSNTTGNRDDIKSIQAGNCY